MKVNEIIQSYKSQYNSKILGKNYFDYSPVFEMFEDFGSLLPNRIDMDDIVSGNDQVEGYKAARNFLSLARLDYSFFQQPSSRILDSLRSTTRILDPLSLSAASPDTLTPLQSILGNPMSGEGFSTSKVNLIVNDTGSFYILYAIILLTGFKGKICVIPSTNVSSIPLLCNILMGWGMDFTVLLFENDDEVQMAGLLKKTVFNTDSGGKELIIRMPEIFLNSEDILSTLDFKNHILNSREVITVPNSVYVREKELPRNFLLSRFLSNVKEGKIKITDFDEETLENFRLITNLLKDLK